MAKTKSELDGKVRGWILRTHPEEKYLIGEFDREITWREVARHLPFHVTPAVWLKHT